MKYDFRGEVPRVDGKPLVDGKPPHGSYPETRAAIEQYYATGKSPQWRRKTQEAFVRESPTPVDGIETMTPSYIRWLIDGGKPLF
jgi:hypothetical protein